jgi:hypothetical protein
MAVSLKTEPLALGTTQNALQNFQQLCGGQADLHRGVMTSVQRGRTKFKLQREGYARAMTSPRRAESHHVQSGRIAMCFIEWSDSFWQDLVIDWTLIRSAEAAQQFGEKIVNAPRSLSGPTSISSAIDFAVAQLKRAPFESERKIVYLSGDEGRPANLRNNLPPGH